MGNEFRRRTETFFSAHLTRTTQNRRGDPSPCKTITIKSHAVACDHHYNASLYYRWQLLPSHPSVSWVDASQAATRLHWYAAHCFPLLVAAIRRNRLFGHSNISLVWFVLLVLLWLTRDGTNDHRWLIRIFSPPYQGVSPLWCVSTPSHLWLCRANSFCLTEVGWTRTECQIDQRWLA